jgi:hypothetical protein
MERNLIIEMMKDVKALLGTQASLVEAFEIMDRNYPNSQWSEFHRLYKTSYYRELATDICEIIKADAVPLKLKPDFKLHVNEIYSKIIGNYNIEQTLMDIMLDYITAD